MSTDIADVLAAHLAGAPLSTTLTALADERPDLAPLTRMLALREQQLLDGPDVTADDEPTDDPFVPVRARSATEDELSLEQLELLRRTLDDLNREVARLQLAVETAARALGACPVCLGADSVCPLCRGRGVPGSLPPDPVAFRRIAVPAVRAYAYARSRSPAPPPDDHHRSNPDTTPQGAPR